jgi:cyclic pyranopterin phosphate synthase
MKIMDPFGRRINYLRISVTDRCNLRCIYCSQGREFKFLPHSEILTYEEFIRIIDVGMKLGVEKVRVTGGEPFVRKGFLEFLTKIINFFPDIDLRVTTNGTLINKEVISRLKHIGINAINVSLDTFDREKFRWITGKDLFDHVPLECSLDHLIRKTAPTISLDEIEILGKLMHIIYFFKSHTCSNSYVFLSCT